MYYKFSQTNISLEMTNVSWWCINLLMCKGKNFVLFFLIRKQKSLVLLGRFLAVNFCTMGHCFFNLSRWSGAHRGDQRLPDHSPRGTLEYVSLSYMSLKEWPRLLQCCATRRTWINGKRKANERVPRNIGATGQPFLN